MRRLLLAIVVASTATIPPASAADSTRLVIGVVGDIDQPMVEREIRHLQYSTLTALAADTLETIPGIAEAWNATAGGWTYTVRAGATWSDGTPVTPADVEFSLAEQRAAFPDLSVTDTADRTVTISGLTEPGLLLPVLPKHAYASDPSVGSGDWHVVARDDNAVTMQVVDRPGRPRLDEIVFRSYRDSDALLGALDSGEVDVAGDVAASDYETLREIDGTTAIHASDGDQWLLELRIDDAMLRRAIARAVDRDRLLAEVARDVGRTSPIPIVARAARFQLEDDAAERIASRLSYDPGAPNVSASLTLSAPDDETGQAIGTFVTAALTQLGIEVSGAPGSVTDVTIVRRDPGDDPTPVLERYTCAAGIWCDSTYDAAYMTFIGTTDSATRIDAVHEMVGLLATEAPEVVLFEPDTLQGYRTDHVIGLLREPSDERLVVFWPSVQQYSEAVPTSTIGGEDIPDSAFAAIAVAVTAAAVAALAIPTVRASGRRKRETRCPS